MRSSEVILRLKNVESFYGPVRALNGVSLELHRGDIVAVLGANGAGKTSLLRTISGVIDPQKGDVILGDSSIAGLDADLIPGRGIVHIPEGREIFPLLTVLENLRMGAYSRRDSSGAISSDIDLVYTYFPVLSERSSQLAGTLSGGQQQMLAIGRGLMARPSIMLLDEPSLGLSPLLGEEIFEIIQRLNREREVTMMLVEQNAYGALSIANYGYVMELGRIVMADDSDVLMRSRDVREFYLGSGGDDDGNDNRRRRWRGQKTWR